MTEPVSLDQAKAQCRIVGDDSEDALIEGYIRAAREWVENYTGHILVRRSFTETRDCFGRFIELQRRPVISITEIGYTDTDGDAQTYVDAVESLDRNPARIYPSLIGWWPSLGRNGGVTIEYTAGYADGEAPDGLVQAILLLVGHFYANREAVNIGTASAVEVPFAVEALAGQYRSPSL